MTDVPAVDLIAQHDQLERFRVPEFFAAERAQPDHHETWRRSVGTVRLGAAPGVITDHMRQGRLEGRVGDVRELATDDVRGKLADELAVRDPQDLPVHELGDRVRRPLGSIDRVEFGL